MNLFLKISSELFKKTVTWKADNEKAGNCRAGTCQTVNRLTCAWQESCAFTFAALLLGAALFLMPPTQLIAAESTARPAAQNVVEEDPVWPDLKEELFQARAIKADTEWLKMEAPYRAHDAALVPIVISANALKPGQYIKALTLIVDNNPVPVAAVFDLSSKLGPLYLETRIRINQYSYVRAIAELNDGSLFMTAKYVKAAGGCSAPAMKDMEARMASIGRMKLRQFTAKTEAAKEQAAKQQSLIALREIQLMVRHPNYSGMQLNQETGYYIPAHYVEKITVNVDGEQLMKVDGAISLSEDPVIRFRFKAKSEQPAVELIVTDTKKQTFKKQWKMKAPSEIGS